MAKENCNLREKRSTWIPVMCPWSSDGLPSFNKYYDESSYRHRSSPHPVLPLKEPPWKSSRLLNPEGESYFQFCDVWQRTENIYKTCLASWLSFACLHSLHSVSLDASSAPPSPLNGQESTGWQKVVEHPLPHVHCSVTSFPRCVCCAGSVIFIILYFRCFKVKNKQTNKKITCRKFYWLI